MIPAGVKIYAAATPVDMRRGLVGLADVAREQLAQDPGSGALLVFVNKRRDRLKLLWHDRDRPLPALQGAADSCRRSRSSSPRWSPPRPVHRRGDERDLAYSFGAPPRGAPHTARTMTASLSRLTS
jgi:hypothetical protein